MRRLLKADFFHLRKSRLTLIAVILAVAFPVLIVLLYAGVNLLVDNDFIDANTIIGSAFSLTNNIGLVLPVFAGIIVCLDCSNGTLRNKVIAGNRRSSIYLSHLLISMLFTVAVILLYAIVTSALALIFFPFRWNDVLPLGKEILYFALYGVMSFAFIATVSTMFALIFRSVAPTIILTIVFSILLLMVNSFLVVLDYEKFKYVVYFIPTFASNIFNLSGSGSILSLLNPGANASRDLIFAEGMLSYVVFGALHTLIGLFFFKKRDLK